MNITFICPPIPYKFDKTPYTPLGIGYLSAAIRKDCEFVSGITFIDGQILSTADYWEKIKSLNTDILLVSATIRQMKCALETINVVKRHSPQSTSILGGPGPSGFPNLSDSVPTNVDVIIKGEAEELLPLILKSINRHRTISIDPTNAQIEICSNNITKIIIPKHLPQINTIPWPDRNIFDQTAYLNRWKTSSGMTSVHLIGSRGCPFNCIFCDHSVTGRQVRLRDTQNIAQEMAYLQQQYQPDDIFFYDDLFTLKNDRVISLCTHLQQQAVNITWSAQGRVDCINQQMLEAMLKAGCNEIMFGVESGSDKLLRYFHKGFSRQQVIDAFTLCHQIGMKAGAYLIVGVPGETRQDILDTISLIEIIEPSLLNLSFLTPFPSTELMTLTKQWVKNWDYEKWDDFQGSVYNYPFEINPKKSYKMITAAYQKKIDQGMLFSSYQFANS